MTFRDLPVGESFSFLPARLCIGNRSRVLTCRKISPRMYAVYLPNRSMTVEHSISVKVPVYQQGLTGITYEV